MKKNTDIVINLDELERNGSLKETELIYRHSYEKLCGTIIHKVKCNVEAISGNSTNLVYQPCFFINGGRGSGKTTLLRAVRQKLCSENAKAGEKIHELADIDPTELAETENFFIHILGRVQKSLSDIKHKKTLSEEEKAYLLCAYTCIRKMSKGLGLLVRRPEEGGNSSDAGFFVQQRVDDCVSGLELKQDFSRLVEALCRLYKVDALLVAVDDADMNFNKCSEVFETVRKYLINPRMVFVFAGDLKLYTMVVRGMQMLHFKKETMDLDQSMNEHRFQLIDALEDQYIMKLLPVENRVWLSDFGEVVESNPQMKLADNSVVSLSYFLREQLRGLVVEHTDSQMLEFIRRLPTRSALQLIAYWSQHVRQDGEKKASEAWAEGIRRVATQALIKQGIDSLAVHKDGLRALIPVVISHAKAMGKGMTGAGFTAGIGNESQQMVSFFLAAEVARSVKKPADIIQYVLRTFSAIQPTVQEDLFIEEYQNARDSRWWGAVCTARMMPKITDFSPGVKLFANGIIPLFSQTMNIGYKTETRISLRSFVDKLVEKVKKENNSLTTYAGLAVYSAMGRVVEQGRSIYCLSVFNLLNIVAALLECQLGAGTAENLEKVVEEVLKKDTISPDVTRIVTERTRPTMRNSDIRNRQGNYMGGADVFDNLKTIIDEPTAMDVVKDILAWLSRVPAEDLNVSSFELRDLWTTFVTNCQIETNSARVLAMYEDDLAKAGELFRKYLKAFFEYGQQTDNEKLKKQMNFISECPLCDVWIQGMKDSPAVFDDCNKLNIGPMELVVDKERADLYCEEKLREAKEQTMRAAVNDFDVACEEFQDDVEQIQKKSDMRVQWECEEKLLPLHERRANLSFEKGKRVKMLKPHEAGAFVCRHVSNLKKKLTGEFANFEEIIKTENKIAKRDFEENLDRDAEERLLKMKEYTRDIQEEREFDHLVNRFLRNYGNDYTMLQTAIKKKMVSNLCAEQEKLHKNIRSIIDRYISEKKEELIDKHNKLLS